MDFLVVPAYEPTKKLINLVQSLSYNKNLSIIVVNDGSSPKYDSIFDEIKSKAEVISYEKNRGKGYALKRAFQYIKNKNEKGIVVTADSDGQHSKEDILKMISYYELEQKQNNGINEKSNFLLTGVRNFKGKVPFKSKLGNLITGWVFYLLTKVNIKDTQCGLRAFDTSNLNNMINIQGERFEYEMNVLLEFAKRGRLKGMPIETIYLEANKSTHFNPIKDSYLIYSEIIKFASSSLMSFIVDYIIYSIMILMVQINDVNLKLIIANVTARIISGTVNYNLNKRVVFKSEATSTWYKYAGLAGGILIINTIILLILNKINLNNLFAIKIFTEIILFILSFLIQKTLIFTSNKKENVK